MQLASGTVSSVDTLGFVTTLEGSRGSSGSPMFDESGNLVGVVERAKDLLSSMTSLFRQFVGDHLWLHMAVVVLNR